MATSKKRSRQKRARRGAAKRLQKTRSMRVVKRPRGRKPTVSVVAIALNEERSIHKVLDSLDAQLDRDFEVILADGNSTDRTVEVAGSRVDGIIVERRRNCAFERNAGILLARGKIIAFCDTDNVLPPDWVQNIKSAFAKDPELLCAWGPIYFSDTSWLERAFSRIAMRTYARLEEIQGRFAPASSNYAARRDAVWAVDGFDTRYTTCEDYDFLLRVQEIGRVRYLPAMEVQSSARRVKKMGYLRFFLAQSGNVRRFLETGKSATEYPEIR